MSSAYQKEKDFRYDVRTPNKALLSGSTVRFVGTHAYVSNT